MEIRFSEKDIREFEKLSLQMDDNEASGAFYNILIQGDELVSKTKVPYPIDLLDETPYRENPYFQNVKPIPHKEGKVRLDYLTTPARKGFVYDEMIEEGRLYEEITPFGFFNNPFKFLALLDKERIWMSVTPHEINTMKEAIDHAHGKVVTLGLGLGYYVYMVLLKDDVEKITVIERDPKVISLFKKHLLPFFPHQEKINIIEADAIDYLKDAEPFDYLFADLWHFAIDGVPLYLQINKFEDKYKNSKFEYWIEPAMLITLRKAMIILVEEEMHGTTDFDYQNARTISDEIINALHFLLKDKEFNNIDELLGFLSQKNLKLLAKSLKLK